MTSGENVDGIKINRINIGEKQLSDELNEIRRRYSSLHASEWTGDDALARWKEFISDASIAQALLFKPKETDVLIATHSKSGTTMLQQIVHALRGGAAEFEEISEVVPWIEMAADAGQVLTEDHANVAFRAFKTHFAFQELPKGGKIIAVLRDPHDVIRSFYRFLRNWFFTDDELSLGDFVDVLLYRRTTPWWSHVAGYIRAAEEHPDKVLLLFFDDVVAHREDCVARVAAFCGVRDQALIDNAVFRSSFAYMKEHATQFDEHMTRRRRDHIWGAVSSGTSASKVRDGKVGLGSDALGAFAEEITAVVASELAKVHPRGCTSFAEMKADAKKHLSAQTFCPTQ